ncbi:MAG: cation-translocating P-type ATPase C-terminal domain-containing protein, partial [Candidatus Colwellbacteria bacterium]|nr:cation-translocating P-type ATPase C-terminal domain-containing protein [Candidatus Colwellbacteria bacterium]
VGVALPLNALQILWVNFFSYSFPAVSLAFEEREGHLNKGPAFTGGKLLDREMKFLIWVVGIITSLFLLSLYFYLLSKGFDGQLVRTFIFAAFSVDTLFSIFSIRSLGGSIIRSNPLSNRYLIFGVLAGFGLTGLAIYLPALQTVLDTVALSPLWLAGVAAVGSVNILAIELCKFVFRRGGKS